MMTSGPLIWKKHKYKDGYQECPHCGAPLRWVWGDGIWYPCDKEPVLFAMHPDGKVTLIYEGEELNKCVMYASGDPRTVGKPLWGYQQHYYTCRYLKKRRAEYIQRLRGEKAK